jgi:sugar phosphate isomerase/epimerase
MDRLGIEFLSVFGMPPVEFVHLAADLGCRYISSTLVGLSVPQLGYPAYSLKDDPRLRNQVLAAMDERGVAISLGEGLLVRRGAETRDLAADLDVMAELRVPRVNTVSFEPDRNRTSDQIAVLAELAADHGMETTIELAPGTTVGDVAAGLAVLDHIGRSDIRLLIDTMHFVRGGGTAAELADVDPDRIGYVQLSDTTLQPRIDDYMREAMFERLVPGEGELPLREIIAVVPPDVIIGLEVPQLSLAEAGVTPFDRLRPSVEAARAIL